MSEAERPHVNEEKVEDQEWGEREGRGSRMRRERVEDQEGGERRWRIRDEKERWKIKNERRRVKFIQKKHGPWLMAS